MGLYQKIYSVMSETEGLKKELTVGYGKNSYNAVSESTVLNLIKPLFKKHGLIMFPVEAEITEHVMTYENNNGTSTRLMSQIVAKYKILDVESGEYEILATVGNGADPQDKGSGKAWTYAYKALLQKTFMLFSGEDTDTTHSDAITEKMTKNKEEKIGNEKAEMLNKLIDEKKKEGADDYKSKILGYYKINGFEELSMSGYVTVLKKLNGGK